MLYSIKLNAKTKVKQKILQNCISSDVNFEQIIESGATTPKHIRNNIYGNQS